MRVLVAEDDAIVAEVVVRALRGEGHVVDVAQSGDEALWMAREIDLDLLILDIQMPQLDGLEVCRTLREERAAVAILMLTGRDRVEDRIAGLDAGADDYLPKPFDVDELLARVRALSRRPRTAPRAVLEADGLRLDLHRREVTKHDIPVDLSAKEMAVLEVLVRNAGRAVSRQQLLSAAWDFAFDPASNVVDAYIKLLRRKIDEPFGTASIETVRGVGYRLTLTD